MQFDLTEEQRAFQASIDNFLAENCPRSRLLAGFNQGHPFDRDLWSKLDELGLGTLLIPQDFGGSGLGLLDAAIVADVLGRYATPGPFLENSIAAHAILNSGDEVQRRKWLPALASGEIRATIAWHEATDGWAPEDWHVAADPLLSGTKSFVPHGDGADLLLVGLAGGALGVVDGEDAGVTLRQIASLDGTRPLYDVTFERVAVEMLAETSPAATRKTFDAGLVLIAADAFGGAHACLHNTIAFARDRVQFGVPIASFQAYKHQVADMATTIEPAFGLYWYAAFLADQDDPAASLYAALAKSELSEIYAAAARRSIELHGGIGYTWEQGCHLWLKRSVFDYHALGSVGELRARAATCLGW